MSYFVRLITIEEAARTLKVSQTTVRKWIRKGLLAEHHEHEHDPKMHRKLMVSLEEVEELRCKLASIGWYKPLKLKDFFPSLYAQLNRLADVADLIVIGFFLFLICAIWFL